MEQKSTTSKILEVFASIAWLSSTVAAVVAAGVAPATM